MAERKQGRRSAETAEETKLKILVTAGTMFCESGFEKVSLRSISEAAGVSHSLIRHHFGSKEQIWYAINDKLHEYIQTYMNELIEQLPKDKPANIHLYQFCTKMLANMLCNPKPMQFIADAIRQEGEFFDYFIDNPTNVEQKFSYFVNQHNLENPDNIIDVWELKWEVMLFAHGAASLKPMLNQVWQDALPEQALLKHWNLFNQLMQTKLNIPPQEALKPSSITELLLPMSCYFSANECCHLG